MLFIIGIGVIHAVLTGTQAAWFCELFNTSTRTSGASIGYRVAASIAGFAPFPAVLLANSLGWLGPALFYVTVGVIGLVGVIATKETWGPRQRSEVDDLIRGDRPVEAVESAPAESPKGRSHTATRPGGGPGAKPILIADASGRA